jgi:hypothetical protein
MPKAVSGAGLDLGHARQIAERMLGHRADRVESFWPAVGGDDSRSFRLWSGTDRMLLKIKKRSGSPVGVYFHSRLKEVSLPVPELIAFDPRGGPKGEACAVWEWIQGKPAEWGPGEPCPYDEAELGELLRRVHDLEFAGPFGFIGDDLSARLFSPLPDLGPISESWSGFFHCDRAARRCFDKGYLSRGEADTLASLPDRLGRELTVAESRLLHMSDVMHNGNLIVRDGRIVAIVDYVESMAGDPRWELAWFDYYFGNLPFDRAPFDMTRFRAAYATDHDPEDPLGRFYLLCILAFEKLLWFEPGSARGRWAIGTTKNILASFAGM